MLIEMGCIKEIYKTHKEAEKAAKGVFNRIGNHMKTYKCEHCRFYHIATANKRKLREVKTYKYPFKLIKPVKIEKMPEPKINIGYKPEKQIIHVGKVFKKIAGIKPNKG